MYRFFIATLLLFISICGNFLEVNAATLGNNTYRPHNYCPYNHNTYHNNYYNNPNYYTRTHTNPSYYRNNSNFYNSNRLNPAYSSRRYHPLSHFSDINALEKYTLNRNFSRESDLQRLQRLEMQAFGAVQSGDISQRYDNVREAILSRPNYTNTKTSLLKSIGNYFGGQLTGFTPSIYDDPYYSTSGLTTIPYPTNYGTQSVNEYSGPFGSKGYTVTNSGTGSSSSIRILD